MGKEPEPLVIPAALIRDDHNQAEFMRMASSVSEEVEAKGKSRPAASKGAPNGAVKTPVKAAGKAKAAPAAKVAPKAEKPTKATAKASKGSEKPKAAKPAKEGAKKDQYGFRDGSSKSQAAALYARKSGATLEEVKEKVGSVQLNVLVSLEEGGYIVERKKEEREGKRPATRYFLKAKK